MKLDPPPVWRCELRGSTHIAIVIPTRGERYKGGSCFTRRQSDKAERLLPGPVVDDARADRQIVLMIVG